MKEQILILKVKFDETDNYSPNNWNWSELIGCGKDCVEILNYGKVETIDERVS